MKILPTLSASVTLEETKKFTWPMLGFFKYDGIRALGYPKLGLVSRKLKLIPNVAVRKKFAACTYLDGELIFGNPTDPTCYNLTESIVMTKNAPADGVHFYVFDSFISPSLGYLDRRKQWELSVLFKAAKDVHYAPMEELHSFRHLLAFEKRAAEMGYEGIMLRRPGGLYKYGRSTANQGWLLKLKRFVDIEVRILEVYPRQKNTNKAETDERGYTKRSSHKAGKVDQAEVGGFLVQEIAGRKRKHFMGPGVLTQAERKWLWMLYKRSPKQIISRPAVCRSQPSGEKDLPRFPRFKGWRSRLDF